MAATIVHDSSEAVELCGSRRLYLKPIAKLAITVLWPGLREQSKAVSNWEVMAKLKQMAHPHQFTSIRVSKSALEFVRFEAEVETRALVQTLCVKMNGRLLEAQGSDSALRVLAVESSPEFPSRQEWDDYFQGGEERPDTVHLEGLPCKWFSSPDSYSQKPREEIVREVFERFGHLRNMDIPALDVYREEMAGRSSSVFSFAGLQTFDVYLQFEEYEDFLRAMESLRGMRLMLKEGDGKALACNIKVTFDMTSHLSEAAVARRQRERKQLEELEEQRQREKRREREEEEADRKRRERRRQEKLRRRAERQREEKRLFLSGEEVQAQDEEELWEERKLVLVQRRLQSIRLLAALLQRVQGVPKAKQEKKLFEKEKLSDQDPDSPGEKTAEMITSEMAIRGKPLKKATSRKKPVVCPPDTTHPDDFTEDLSPDHSMPPYKSHKYDYGPFNVTISQNHSERDLSQHLRPTFSHITESYSASFARSISGEKPFPRALKQKEKIYESEEFMNYLLNHYSHPSYARLCQSPRPSRDKAADWHRMVSDNGKGFQISLRNMDGKLCTEVSISQNAGKISPSNEDRYKWKITIKETEPGRRKIGIQGSREFEVCWNESGAQCAMEDMDKVHNQKDSSAMKRLTVKNIESLGPSKSKNEGKPALFASFRKRTSPTDAKVVFGESDRPFEAVSEKESIADNTKTQDLKEAAGLLRGFDGGVSFLEVGSGNAETLQDEGEIVERGGPNKGGTMVKHDQKKTKKKRKKSKADCGASDNEADQTNKKRKKKRKDKHKNSGGGKKDPSSKPEESEKRKKKHKVSEWNKVHLKQKKVNTEFQQPPWDRPPKKPKMVSYPKPWNGFANRYHYGNEFSGWDYFPPKPYKGFAGNRGFGNEMNPAAKGSSWYTGGDYAEYNQDLGSVQKKKLKTKKMK